MLNNKREIQDWLEKFNIQKYTIHDDMTVDVKGNVILFNKQLTEIPIEFGIVAGSFNCDENKLTSLKLSQRSRRRFLLSR